MGEFFKGRRRKAGCGALVIAAILTVTWMRSYSFEDKLGFASGKSVHDILSCSGTIQWHKSTPAWIASGWSTNALSPSDNVISPFDTEFFKTNRRWEWHGLIFCEAEFLFDDLKVTAWIFPYWMVVLPITLYSAYMIHWNPRPESAPRISN